MYQGPPQLLDVPYLQQWWYACTLHMSTPCQRGQRLDPSARAQQGMWICWTLCILSRYAYQHAWSCTAYVWCEKDWPDMSRSVVTIPGERLCMPILEMPDIFSSACIGSLSQCNWHSGTDSEHTYLQTVTAVCQYKWHIANSYANQQQQQDRRCTFCNAQVMHSWQWVLQIILSWRLFSCGVMLQWWSTASPQH